MDLWFSYATGDTVHLRAIVLIGGFVVFLSSYATGEGASICYCVAYVALSSVAGILVYLVNSCTVASLVNRIS